MRGKTAKKLRKLAQSMGVTDATYIEKQFKKYIIDPVTKKRIDYTVYTRRLVPESTRYAYQRLKKVWPQRKEHLNEIYRGLL
jgi:hypothetical protein